MFWHVILGLLRDGRPRHGYELMTDYTVRSGTKVSAGNFYRELARLATDGFVETDINPPEADARRIPYRIKQLGCDAFDRWLASPTGEDGDLGTWLLFADRTTPEVRERILERREEELWVRSKTLARLRDDAVATQNGSSPSIRYNPLPFLLSRQLKLVAGELEFLREFRTEFGAQQRGAERVTANVPTIDAVGPMSKRKKGSSRK